ncbi:MAG TPA: hypothetical protein DCM05_06640 [Elusimicrobia bacterium]|nr:hypothetical protein [Elusimicrobiota bacterium]
MTPIHADRITVNVLGRDCTLEIDGISPLDAPGLTSLIEKKAEEIRKEFGVHDTLTLMRMLLVLLAADIHQLNEKMENFNRIEEKSLDSMIVALDTALGTQKP